MWDVFIADSDGNCDQINDTPYSIGELGLFLSECEWPISAVLLFPAPANSTVSSGILSDSVDSSRCFSVEPVNETFKSFKLISRVHNRDKY